MSVKPSASRVPVCSPSSLLSLSSSDVPAAWRAPERQHTAQENELDQEDDRERDREKEDPPGSSALLLILSVEEIDVNLYRGVSPSHPRWGRVYGGQTVSQAMVAAMRTIQPPLVIHSLHSYFLRAGDDSIPILYQIERLRDGKSFSSRRVTAIQKGQAIFIAMMSFQRPEQGALQHQDNMSAVPNPHSLPSLIETMRNWAKDERLPYTVRQGILRSSSFPFPIDLRRVDNHSLTQRLTPRPDATQRCFMRAVGTLGESLIMHQCALAYMSDWSLLETTLLPHGIHSYQNTEQKSIQMASIDHSMWFHHPFRADEWLLYSMHSSVAGGSRGLAYGTFYSLSGKLLVSVAQEGLIRLRIGNQIPGSSTDQQQNREQRTKESEEESKERSQPSTHYTMLPSAL